MTPPNQTKKIQEFDGRTAKLITHAIYLIVTFDIYIESLALLLITKLKNHPMILDQPWMKKHRVIINMINDFLAFWPSQ